MRKKIVITIVILIRITMRLNITHPQKRYIHPLFFLVEIKMRKMIYSLTKVICSTIGFHGKFTENKYTHPQTRKYSSTVFPHGNVNGKIDVLIRKKRIYSPTVFLIEN